METADFDVKPEYERLNLDRIGDLDLWENSGFLIRGRTAEGTDLMLWLAQYVVKQGDPVASYYAINANVNQTLAVVTPPGQDRGSLSDNSFVASGWQLAELMPFGSIQETVTDDGTSWDSGLRTMTAAPPRWTIEGEQSGVATSIEMEALAPAFWAYPMDELLDRGAGWYEVYCRARGKVVLDGVPHDFTGFACHERISITRDHEPERLKGRGLHWHHLFDERVQCWLMVSPSVGMAVAHLVVDGEVHHVTDPAEIEFVEGEQWVDPESGFRHARTWAVRVRTPVGTLAYDAGAFARAYYPWIGFKATTNILYWMTAQATGRFEHTDGSRIDFTEAQYVAHSNRAFHSTGRHG